MKKLLRVLYLVSLLAVLAPPAAHAQEFFRDYGTSRSSGGFGPIVPSEYSYENASPSGLTPLRPGEDLTAYEQATENDKYNFALGPINFGVAAGFGVEFNDNVNLSDHNRLSDIIFRPELDLLASWRFSELNTLKIEVGASYAKYLDHSEYDTDGVLITPNSELALTFFVGAVKFTLRDRLSYQQDAYDQPQLSNTANYERGENQAGLEMDWAINQNLDFTAGYDHFNLWPHGNDFSLQDRTIDTVYLRPSVQVVPGVKVGVNASYSFINFDSSDRSDGDSILVGPFVEWQISEYTNLYLEGGYQAVSFDGGSDYNQATIRGLNLSASDSQAVRDILRDSEDSNTYYIKFEINNRPNEYFQHRLSFSKTSEIGFESNFFDLYHVEYNSDWKIFRNTEFGPTVFYEHYTTSGDLGEHADRIGAALGIRYHMTNNVTLGLDYRFLLKDSNIPDANYYQNLAFLSIYYKF